MGRAFELRKGRKMKRWSAMAKTFTRIGKDIVMAIKDGGPNPDSNSRLRAVMQNAKAANMPKDNVERAIKKATDKDTANYKEALFEGYAPHGIAIVLETATCEYVTKHNSQREHTPAIIYTIGDKRRLNWKS